MLGAEGMTDATRHAILNANYIKARLEPYYPVLYTRENGRVAHEMIFDLRAFKAKGVDEIDVAKRLMDYGFHAPTVSFPVPGTLMIEPTESEPKAELDRFCDALIAIRQEIEEVITGAADPKDNVLKNAPHTAAVVTSDTWTHPYPRERRRFAAVGESRQVWLPSGIDNPRRSDLVCVCPPMESYV
jgi:glycine dehydrogenase